MCIPTKKLLNRGFLFVKLKSNFKGFMVAPSPITYDFTFHIHILRCYFLKLYTHKIKDNKNTTEIRRYVRFPLISVI
jgi:hypothetical protein